jgi:osmotically-inducible protein OsmY
LAQRPAPRQTLESRDEEDDDRRGYGAYGGAYGQGSSGNYAGGYDNSQREREDDVDRGGYGQGSMRGQSYGSRTYRSREDYDRAYGFEGSSYGQRGQSFYEPGEQTYPRYGQGGYPQAGQGSGEPSGYGPRSYGTSYGGGYSGPSLAGQRAAPYTQTAERNWGEAYRGREELAGPSRRALSAQDYGGQFGGYSQGFGPAQGFGSEQSGSYLTRGGRQRWGRHTGRGPKNYTRSDDRIREDVNDRLTDDPDIDASDIEVKVSNCEVTLTGTVDSRDDKRRAEDCAESVSGVKNVQNNLRVQGGDEETTRTGAGKKGKAGDGEQRMQ